MDRKLTPPTFPALLVTNESGRKQSVLWCPWCEGTHWHGAIAGRANRAPHCMADRHSPLGRTGYVVEVVGEAKLAASVTPGKPLNLHRVLHQVLADAGVAIRKAVLHPLLDLNRISETTTEKRTARAHLWLFDLATWRIEARDRSPETGRGLIGLAASLYAVPPGIAAVRLLEAVNGTLLDEEAAFGIKAVIDAWHDRGSPQRPER